MQHERAGSLGGCEVMPDTKFIFNSSSK